MFPRILETSGKTVAYLHSKLSETPDGASTFAPGGSKSIAASVRLYQAVEYFLKLVLYPPSGELSRRKFFHAPMQ